MDVKKRANTCSKTRDQWQEQARPGPLPWPPQKTEERDGNSNKHNEITNQSGSSKTCFGNLFFFLAAQPQQTTVNQFPVPGTSSVVVEPTPPCVFVNVVMWQQLKRGKGQSGQFGCCPVFDTYPMRIGGVAGRVIERRADSERNCVTRVFNQVNNVAVVQPRDVMVIDGQNSVSDMQARTPLSGAIADDLT